MTQTTTESPSFQTRPFGRYFLIDKMAVGGMAEVFNAIFFGIHGFEMPIIIKRILPSLSANEKFVDMFVIEAKIYVALQHQNIVQIYDFNKFQDQYFIALEFVEGRDLKTLLQTLQKNSQRLPIEQALFIAHQISHGLEYAHTRCDDNGENLGLVHRDLSPANILLSYTGEVKVADFGIAKAKMHVEITDAGVLKGKYKYMSPEQARGEEIDHRSDIFAVGILLYEMTTGFPLFQANSDVELLEKVRNAEYIEPRKHNPALSPRLNKIICRALHPSPHGRFQSIKDLQEAIAGEMHPHTVSSLTRGLSLLMDDTFAESKRTDRERRKLNRDRAFEQFQEFEDGLDEVELEIEDFDTQESLPVENFETLYRGCHQELERAIWTRNIFIGLSVLLTLLLLAL